MDIMRRAAKLADKLYVVVLVNSAKKPMFAPEERVLFLNECIRNLGLGNIVVDSFSGLLADYAKKVNAGCVIRSLRSGADFEYERPLALANDILCPGLETLFLAADPKYFHISSSLAKEIASHGGCTDAMVPADVSSRMQEKLASQRHNRV